VSGAEFRRGERVLYRRSVLCGRTPEFGIVQKRHKDFMDGRWYVVVDEDRPGSRGCSEHAEMIADASDGWVGREIERLNRDADEAARGGNGNPVLRHKADALREVARRLAS
jgi:hypothetical protein